jgi:hypothetical protein
MRASLIGHSDRCSDRKRCRAEQETVPRPIVPDDLANDMGGSSGQVFGVACEVRNRILRNITRLGIRPDSLLQTRQARQRVLRPLWRRNSTQRPFPSLIEPSDVIGG